MQRSRGDRVAGQGDQRHAVVSAGGLLAPTTGEDERELAELEDQDEDIRLAAESLGRRLHDQKLRDDLAAENFTGLAWNRFTDELARYGHAVLMAWMRTGAIVAQCAKKGRPIGDTPSFWTADDQTDLATDAVAGGIGLFQDRALVQGGWRFEAGASLKTFFVGAAVLAFPTIYRQWWRDREDEARIRAVGAALDLEGFFEPNSYGDPCEITARWSAIQEALNGLPDERTQRVVAATALGYSYVETAELLSVENEASEGTVAQILFRHRRRTDKKESA